MSFESILRHKRKHSFSIPLNSVTRFVPPRSDDHEDEMEASSDSASSQDDNSPSDQFEDPSETDSETDFCSSDSFDGESSRWHVASSSTTALDSPTRGREMTAHSPAPPRSSRKGTVERLLHICSQSGCGKSYKRLARLTEHMRSHTGERPFVCDICGKSYQRETHLQSHTRSHLPESERPFACEESGCGKRFWTSSQFKVHEKFHRGENTFKCGEEGCEALFTKHNQLRKHVVELHSPPGTKLLPCEHPGCPKSFDTNQHLRAHMKIHQEKRYLCSHLTCPEPYFNNWSSLQIHMRVAHPPTCPYPECNGRTFSQTKNLKAHLKTHRERELDDIAEKARGDADGIRESKRRRGGEVGRDWHCAVEGCTKSFKSNKALTNHTNITHLGKRDFACLFESCGRTFGYKHLLQRHSASEHRTSPSDIEDFTGTEGEGVVSHIASTIDLLTGKAYVDQARERNKVRCPWPSGFDSRSVDSESSCGHMYGRAYDMRRHWKAVHGFEVEKELVASWMEIQRQRSREE